MNVADIVLIVIILASMIIGGIRGVIMSLYGLITTALSALLAFKFAEPVQQMLVGTSLYISVYTKIEEMVQKIIPDLGTLEETLIGTINSLPFPDSMKQSLIDGLSLTASTTQSEAMGSLVGNITNIVIAIIVGIIIFIILLIVFALLKGLVKKISDFPVIKQVDAVVGAVLGIASGFLAAYIICIIVSGLQTTELMVKVHEVIVNSKYASMLYNNNLLLKLFP
jgi:uncharacterized membrane protein required for colicin V production